MSDTAKPATIKDVADALRVPGETLSDFSKAWKDTDDETKAWYKEEVTRAKG